MKRLFPFWTLCILILPFQMQAQQVDLYVGTYTTGNSQGIYHYRFDTQTGSFDFKESASDIQNPSFLKISPDGKMLYSVLELDSFDGEKGGGIAAFEIKDEGRLQKMNSTPTQGSSPCHICTSPNGKTIIVSNYGGGNISVFNPLSTNQISPIVQRIQHEGTGFDPKRQPAPRAHSSQFNAQGNLLFTADLGLDKLMIYQFGKNKKLIPFKQPFVEMPGGAGPRHFAFTRKQDFIYVINELNSSISVIKKTKKGFERIQDISTLPTNFSDASYCADIHLSADERFVYGSNRGHNSIAIFERNQQDGTLRMLTTESVHGNWPRNFAIAPGGKFLLVANQKSDNITVFKIDQQTGSLTYTGTEIQIPSPVCLEFLAK